MLSVAAFGLPGQNVSLTIEWVIPHFPCLRLKSHQVYSRR